MIPTDSESKAENRFKWLPIAAQHYHLHKEQGKPIRTIARDRGCHASTVSRQVKRIQRMLDDPAVRATLNKLKQVQSLQSPQLPSKPEAESEEKRILRLLRTKGAVLVLAENMQKALIVTEEQAQSTIPIGTVSAEVAQALAM
ncbi:helix-turn-helix domain-containing protein [Rhodobacteraceae bacterium]|nr:helix-turn-helix domain-containing protein [Paracoccaceae bacterium]